MSIATAFSNSKQALRRGAFALATAATLFGANAAQAANFTADECKTIFATSLHVVNELGKETLSNEFRTSLVRFMIPDGKNLACDVNSPIEMQTTKDNTAMATIDSLLPFDIRARGVRLLDNSKTASLSLN